MEFWDALEDSQYLDAVACSRDGPKPIWRWEIPTPEQLIEWEKRVQARTTSTTHPQNYTQDEDDPSVEPLTLDWYVSCPIGFFFFSSFVKEQRLSLTQPEETLDSKTEEPVEEKSNNDTVAAAPPTKKTSLLEDQLAYVRMNFLEDLLRFQKAAKATRMAAEIDSSKVTHLSGIQLLRYLQPPEKEPESGALILPKMTEIRELDLRHPRCRSARLLRAATEAQVEVSLNANHENTYKNNLVGLTGPLFQEIVSALEGWTEMHSSSRKKKLEAEPKTDSSTKNGGDFTPDNPQQQSTGEDQTQRKQETVQSPREPNPEANLRSVEISEGDTPNTDAINPNTIIGSTNLLHSILQKAEVIVYESLKRDYGSAFLANSPQYCRMRNFLWYQDRRVVHEDFYIMRVLGRGGFGLVSACQKGTTGKLYVMKVMSKCRIKMKKSVQFVINERKALAAVSESQFIVSLNYSLHSNDEVYLVLDLMSGGDLGFHLHQRRRFGVNQCLYYAARIMLGLQALHDKSYAYRDLKPENCLLSEDGRVKLTDLGLATKTTPQLPFGVVGTRGYWAPEMHKRDEIGKRMSYNHTVDWFSFGCCLAEFISGKNPFRSEAALKFGMERGETTKDKALDLAIQEWEPELSPELFTPDASDLCRRLLDKDPKTRLGARGCDEIMAHPWFKSVDWEGIITDRRKPPYIPPKDVNAASQHEIGNFAESNSKASKVIAFDESDERVYQDWDWTNPKAYTTEVLEFLIHEREIGKPLVPETFSDDLCCCNIL